MITKYDGCCAKIVVVVLNYGGRLLWVSDNILSATVWFIIDLALALYMQFWMMFHYLREIKETRKRFMATEFDSNVHKERKQDSEKVRKEKGYVDVTTRYFSGYHCTICQPAISVVSSIIFRYLCSIFRPVISFVSFVSSIISRLSLHYASINIIICFSRFIDNCPVKMAVSADQ